VPARGATEGGHSGDGTRFGPHGRARRSEILPKAGFRVGVGDLLPQLTVKNISALRRNSDPDAQPTRHPDALEGLSAPPHVPAAHDGRASTRESNA